MLNIAYCNFIWPNRVSKWKRDSRVSDAINICGVNEKFYPYFVPDKSQHGDFEVFVYDKTHLVVILEKLFVWIRFLESQKQHGIK